MTRGGLSYEEHTGVCHELGSYFQEKIPKKGMLIFHRNAGKGYNICNLRKSISYFHGINDKPKEN